MKKHMTLLLALIVGLYVARDVSQAQEGAAAPGVKLETTIEKASYAIGYLTVKNWRRQGADFAQTQVVAGMKAAYADDAKPAMTEEEMDKALEAFEGELREAMQKKRAEEAETNKKSGEAYLAANKSKEGVVVLPSGLQYKVLKEGDGAQPKASDTVTVHYKGTLIDGTEFDSSYGRGEPATFPVTGVIKGWVEALQLMKVGSKWQLFIPADLAYGANPRPGGPIGPNSVLVFEVELIAIK